MSFELAVHMAVVALFSLDHEVVTPMMVFRYMREHFELVSADDALARIEAEIDKQMRTMCRVNNSVRHMLQCYKGTITTSSENRAVGYFRLDVPLDGCMDLLISAYEEDKDGFCRKTTR